MRATLKRAVWLLIPIMLTAGLSACGGSDATGSGSANPPGTPQQVNPKSVGGSSGQGPIIVTNPSSPISLPDRVLTIVSAKRIYSQARKVTLVDLTLTISNPGTTALNNQPKFFSLIASGGDVFDHQDNSSDDFYGPIGPKTSRTGLIEFQIPTSKVIAFQLLYRPDVSADAVLAQLAFS
jgi:hypothetical protein